MLGGDVVVVGVVKCSGHEYNVLLRSGCLMILDLVCMVLHLGRL